MKNYHSPSGFTIIELVVAISLMVLLLMMVMGIYVISQRAYTKIDHQAEISQNGRVIMDRLVRELRQTPDIVTDLPVDNSDPESLPNELLFQDGHDISTISYLRYYLAAGELHRQIITYSFASAPGFYVRWSDIDQGGNPPDATIVEDKVIGEFVSDVEFWNFPLVNINLYLEYDDQNLIINTAVYGRNL